MVFTNLGTNEKQAFFDLLDEYFASRPELVANLGASSPSHAEETSAAGLPLNKRAAASAVHSALAANPEATASLISAGLRHGALSSNSVKNSPFAQAAANPEIANSVGRVAAASLAFQGGPKKAAPVPPALPRRTSSSVASHESHEEDELSSLHHPPGRPPAPGKSAGASGLTQGRAFGDVKADSFKSAYLSIRHGTENKKKAPPSVAPPIPPAFPKQRNNFPPPPVRHASESPARSVSPEAQFEPELEPEEEEGEWAETLYDYNSGEAGDLVLRAHQRVRIVSKDSDDWWTGELDGKSGLFPASYVKVV